MNVLFYDHDGKPYDSEKVFQCLIDIGAGDCQYLFVHSDIMFGQVSGDFNRKEYIRLLYDAIKSLKVDLIIPTFTYSFPNHEIYDVRKSRTSMGALNEYVRKLEGRYRTMDPLLSLSVPDNLYVQFQGLTSHSLGIGSGLDIVHHLDGVKFLFFGAEMGECFTYLHYVEKMMEVSYRFDMAFEGTVIDERGIQSSIVQTIYTQCDGVSLPQKYDYFEREMEERGILKKKQLGDKSIACISESEAYYEIKEHIARNRYYYVVQPYKDTDLRHVYTYDYTKGKITHC